MSVFATLLDRCGEQQTTSRYFTSLPVSGLCPLSLSLANDLPGVAPHLALINGQLLKTMPQKVTLKSKIPLYYRGSDLQTLHPLIFSGFSAQVFHLFVFVQLLFKHPILCLNSPYCCQYNPLIQSEQAIRKKHSPL